MCVIIDEVLLIMLFKVFFWIIIMFLNDNYVYDESCWICFLYVKIFFIRIINIDEEIYDLIFIYNVVRLCNFLGIMIGIVRFVVKNMDILFKF